MHTCTQIHTNITLLNFIIKMSQNIPDFKYLKTMQEPNKL